MTLSTNQLKRILQGIIIPPQPQIMVDLYMENAMPEPEIDRIANIVSQDVGLSSGMLKFVNSSSFGLQRKVTSIKQAVILLGIDAVTNIINGLAVKRDLTDGSIKSLQGIWDNSMDVAVTCSSLAKQVGFKYQDECYALGLFHNAGIPLMMGKFDNYSSVVKNGYNDELFNLTDLENKCFKTNHSVIGYYLAKSWGLPKASSYVIANHHRVADIFSDGFVGSSKIKTLTALLKMSEHVCKTSIRVGNSSSDTEWSLIGYYCLEYLELTQYDFEGMVEVCMEEGLS